METVDAFHRGKFKLVQPRLNGHRSGMDAMLLASLVASDFKGHVLDLGAGVGAAGFAVAARCPHAKITLVENAPLMVEYAKKTCALPDNQYIAQRVTIIEADVTLRGKKRQEAGLFNHTYDFALMNPPFNAAHDRQSPDALRAKAHVMHDDLFENWLRSASALVKPHGYLGLIARPQSLVEIISSLDGRFGDIKLIPLHSLEKKPAIRILLHAKRASRAPLSILPALTLHEKDAKNFSKQVDDLNNGSISYWDYFK